MSSKAKALALEFAAFSRRLWVELCIERRKSIGFYQCRISYAHAVQIVNQLKEDELKKDELNTMLEGMDEAMDVDSDCDNDDDSKTQEDLECSQGAASASE